MTSPVLTETCPSCAGAIAMDHCEICGERRPSLRIYTLRAFAHEAFEVVTNVERSLLKTLWTLIRKPGELTAAYMRGERVRFLRPLQLFLLINVAFFFFAGTASSVYTTTLYNHLYNSSHEVAARRIVAERRPSDMPYKQYEAAFNQKTRVLARTLVIVIAPTFALGVALMSLRRRKPAVQHLVFGLHYLSYMLLLTVAMSVTLQALAFVWVKVGGGGAGERAEDLVAGILMMLGIAAYLYPAFRRAYGDGRLAAAIKAVAGVVMIIFVLMSVYRTLLFYVTAYSL